MEKFSATYHKKINLELDEHTLGFIADNIYDCFLNSLSDYVDESTDDIPGSILKKIFKRVTNCIIQEKI